ncbi:hypothetical protein ACFYW1_35750 [Streptomyces sp. NPDC002669]|uniref:hypothetical protein n=1 Tax=Streptomyces sp. NPDC002669 TaxID=3364658 RepID=UPI003693504E
MQEVHVLAPQAKRLADTQTGPEEQREQEAVARGAGSREDPIDLPGEQDGGRQLDLGCFEDRGTDVPN